MAPIPLIGTEFASYRIDALLGRGGFSVVYRAENPRLGNLVALKILAPELAAQDSFRARFVHESRVAASINHPNIVPIYDFGDQDELLYIAMRYVQGSDLKALIREHGELSPEHTVSILSQAARALDAAHALGLIHRDVKPANFLLEWGGSGQGGEHVYLSDFGLTKHSMSHSGLTGTGEFVGTIDYVAPEQIEGKPVDARTDIYSLGCVMYECLTGRIPFPKEAEMAVLWAHVHEMPMPPSRASPGLPGAIDGVVLKALAKAPDDRYQTCREMLADAASALHVTAPQPLPHRDDVVLAAAGETVPAGARPAPPLQSPAGAEESGAPAPGLHADADAPTTPGRSGSDTPIGGPPARWWRPGRRILAAAIVALIAIAGGVFWWSERSDRASSAEAANPILMALTTANQTSEQRGLLPPDKCRVVTPAEVTCIGLPDGVLRATFKTYRSLSALYTAYVAKVTRLHTAPLPLWNTKDCTFRQIMGEVSWNHERHHSHDYTIQQLEDPNINEESEAAGRVYCFVAANGTYHVVWTQNSGHLFGIAAASAHQAGYSWWKVIHHNIGLEPAGME
jgi:serine/threonine-protein kinase